MGAGTLSKVERAGRWTGQFLADFSYLLSTLLVYVILVVGTYLVLLWKLWPDQEKALFIAYEAATGADPFNFASDLKRFFWLWVWIMVFHVISWLAVPVLAATAVDAACRIFEEKRSRGERSLRRRIRLMGEEHLGLSGKKLDEFEDQEYEKMKEEAR